MNTNDGGPAFPFSRFNARRTGGAMICMELRDFAVTDEDGRNTVDYVFGIRVLREADTAWEITRLTWCYLIIHLNEWDAEFRQYSSDSDTALLSMLRTWLADSPILMSRFQEACDEQWVQDQLDAAETRAERQRELAERR